MLVFVSVYTSSTSAAAYSCHFNFGFVKLIFSAWPPSCLIRVHQCSRQSVQVLYSGIYQYIPISTAVDLRSQVIEEITEGFLRAFNKTINSHDSRHAISHLYPLVGQYKLRISALIELCETPCIRHFDLTLRYNLVTKVERCFLRC